VFSNSCHSCSPEDIIGGIHADKLISLKVQKGAKETGGEGGVGGWEYLMWGIGCCDEVLQGLPWR